MKDILPGSSELWQGLEKNAVSVLCQFGYREIRTPVLEEKGLFVKSIGGETDIVTKEMFSFVDRGERDVNFYCGNEHVYEQTYFKSFPKETKRGYAVEVVIPIDDIKTFYKEVRETKMWTDAGEAELKKVIQEYKDSFIVSK